jgi:hypothetical protein
MQYEMIVLFMQADQGKFERDPNNPNYLNLGW